MAFNPPVRAPLPAPDPSEFENFKRKATFRDYVIYGMVFLVVAGLVGGAVYYFTRTEQEKDKLLGKMERSLDTVGLAKEKEPVALPQLKEPKLQGILGEGEAPAEAPAPVDTRPKPKAVAVSSYAGGGQNGVTLSDDPKLPKATPAFIAFVEALKVSSVLDGNPAKAMFNGRVVRAGDLIDAEQGVTFSGVNGAKKLLVLRDQTGAELYLSY